MRASNNLSGRRGVALLGLMFALAVGGRAQAAEPAGARVNPKDRLKYVWIPPGTFMMGCSPGDNECYDEEKPSHQVRISKGFWMGQTPVTVAAYKRFAAIGVSMPPETGFGQGLSHGWGNEQMPIIDVTWEEAQAYCGWVGGRLPTEAEWEYAARGGSEEARYRPLEEVAWYADNSGRERLDSARILREEQDKWLDRLKENGNGKHDVGGKRANGFGLFDVLGNVWEWVNDWYDEKYYQTSPTVDPPGPSNGQVRVLRGGSWGDPPRQVRVSIRNRDDPEVMANTFGFRCVGELGSP